MAKALLEKVDKEHKGSMGFGEFADWFTATVKQVFAFRAQAARQAEQAQQEAGHSAHTLYVHSPVAAARVVTHAQGEALALVEGQTDRLAAAV